MTVRWLLMALLLLPMVILTPAPQAASPGAVERGRQALLGRPFNPAVWSEEAFDKAWRSWATACSSVARRSSKRRRSSSNAACCRDL